MAASSRIADIERFKMLRNCSNVRFGGWPQLVGATL
jgi:hypothetical protein